VGSWASNLAARLPAQPASVPRARHLVRDLLIRNHLDPADHPGVLLSVSEACTNAVVHGYPDEGGDLDLEAFLDGSVLRVSVRDFGVGPEARAREPGLGYGMLLIKAHTHALTVRNCGPGTEVMMTFDLAARREPGAAKALGR
jgi:anti-sigma regulatory factor (Ser/Thr protein kinase)